VSSDQLWKILTEWVYPALLVLFFFGLTIFVHELGHFLVAKRRRMKIERFSIGFGPKIFGWTGRDGVDYRVAWLPFGGYVALPQMAPMEALEGKSESKTEELPPASPSSKIMVALAGPLLNVVFAFGLACLVWGVGLPTPVNPSVIGWVEPGSLEEQSGLRPRDRIVQVNDRPVKTWMEVNRAVAISREPTVRLVVDRAGERLEFWVEATFDKQIGIKTINLYPQGRPFARAVLPGSPAEQAGVQAGDKFLAVGAAPVSSAEELRELTGKCADQPTPFKVLRAGKILVLTITPALDPKEKVGRIGIQLGDELEYRMTRPGPTPWAQFDDILRMMGDTVYALAHAKQTGIGARSLSGPVGIMGGWWYEIIHGGVMRGVWFAVLLNLNLAILNLLPLPVLDGGHIIFSMIEAALRRPLPARFVSALQTGFAALLIGFMLYITFFDIQRMSFGRLRLGRPVETNAPAAQP